MKKTPRQHNANSPHSTTFTLLISSFFLFLSIILTSCSYAKDNNLLSNLIESWSNLPAEYQNTTELNAFITDFELYKESDEFYVNTMINLEYQEIVDKIDEQLLALKSAENQTEFFDCYTNTSKLLMRLVKVDSSINKKTIIASIFVFLSIFAFIFLLSLFLFIFLSKYEKLRNESKEIGYYSDFMFREVQDERRRISRELHDTVCQDLRAAKIETELMNLTEEKNKEKKEAVVEMLSKSINDLRSICNTLSPLGNKTDNQTSVWETFVLSLENLIESKKQKTEIQYNVKIEPGIDAGNLNLYKFGNIFRIIQEAFSNIEKHSQATSASLLIRNNELNNKKSILIFIVDDGCGMKNTTPSGMHFGLNNMRHRASEIGADFSIISELGDGTKIRLEVPVE